MTEPKELIVKEDINPVAVFSAGGSKELLARIDKIARSDVYDMSTKKGPNALRSGAMKIAKSRTFLDEKRKELLEDMKVKTKAINTEWNEIEEFLLALQDEIRKPLTDLEEAEKKRVADIEGRIVKIQTAAADIVSDWDTGSVNNMKRILKAIEDVSLTDGSWDNQLEEAVEAKDAAVTSIKDAIQKREVADKQAAELEALRQAEVDRVEKEREDAIRREAEEKAAAAAEEATRQAEAAKLAAIAEKAEAEQKIKDLEAEAERVKLAAEKAAEDAEKLAKYEAQQAEQAKIEAAELAAEKERANIEAERSAAAAKLAAKEADEANRKRVHNEIREAFFEYGGLDGDLSTEATLAIINGRIPNLRIVY